MNKIIIYGRLPSLKNSKIISCMGKRPMLFPSKQHKEWHKDASSQLLGIKKIPAGTPITFTYYPPDKRPGDLDNKWQSVGDLFKDNGIVDDDNWFIFPDIHLKFGGIDKENPRCEIEYD